MNYKLNKILLISCHATDLPLPVVGSLPTLTVRAAGQAPALPLLFWGFPFLLCAHKRHIFRGRGQRQSVQLKPTSGNVCVQREEFFLVSPLLSISLFELVGLEIVFFSELWQKCQQVWQRNSLTKAPRTRVPQDSLYNEDAARSVGSSYTFLTWSGMMPNTVTSFPSSSSIMSQTCWRPEGLEVSFITAGGWAQRKRGWNGITEA